MLGLKKIRIRANELIAKNNKKNILKKLEEYYYNVNRNTDISAKEYAIYAFWLAKRQGRLDSLNRIVKINPNKTL